MADWNEFKNAFRRFEDSANHNFERCKNNADSLFEIYKKIDFEINDLATLGNKIDRFKDQITDYNKNKRELNDFLEKLKHLLAKVNRRLKELRASGQTPQPVTDETRPEGGDVNQNVDVDVDVRVDTNKLEEKNIQQLLGTLNQLIETIGEDEAKKIGIDINIINQAQSAINSGDQNQITNIRRQMIIFINIIERQKENLEKLKSDWLRCLNAMENNLMDIAPFKPKISDKDFPNYEPGLLRNAKKSAPWLKSHKSTEELEKEKDECFRLIREIKPVFERDLSTMLNFFKGETGSRRAIHMIPELFDRIRKIRDLTEESREYVSATLRHPSYKRRYTDEKWQGPEEKRNVREKWMQVDEFINNANKQIKNYEKFIAGVTTSSYPFNLNALWQQTIRSLNLRSIA